MKTLLTLAAFGAAGLSGAATAQGAKPPAVMPGGGDMTRADAKQRADLMFSRFDMNKDGTVTKAEAQAETAQYEASRGDDGRGAGRMGRMIDRAFGTATSMTLAQFEAQALARFDAMDLNRDGTVSATERAQLRAQRDAQ